LNGWLVFLSLGLELFKKRSVDPRLHREASLAVSTLMKKSLILSAAIFAVASFSAHAADLKLGTLDMKQIFDSYYKTKDAETKLNETRSVAKKSLEERLANFNKAQEEARKLNDEAGKPELSEADRTAKTKGLNEKLQVLGAMQRDLQEFQQTSEKQLTEQSVTTRNVLLEEINKVVAAKVKAGAYDMVFDRSGQSLNAVGVLLHSKPTFDFTPEVIQELNKHPAKK
jgi:Skp family chaperone for outer membrane proteins